MTMIDVCSEITERRVFGYRCLWMRNEMCVPLLIENGERGGKWGCRSWSV